MSEDEMHCGTSTQQHPDNLRSQRNTEQKTGQYQPSEKDAAKVFKTDSDPDESDGGASSGLKSQQSKTEQHTTSQNTSSLSNGNLGKSDFQSVSAGGGGTAGVSSVDCISDGGETNNTINPGLNTADSIRHKTTIPIGGNDNINLLPGNTYEPPQIENALEYVRHMQRNQPKIYKSYVNIMNRYRNGDICLGVTIRKLCNIFRDDIELISGFNMFLPPGHKIMVHYNNDCISEHVVSIPAGCFGLYIDKATLHLRTQQYKPTKNKTSCNTSSIANGNLGGGTINAVNSGIKIADPITDRRPLLAAAFEYIHQMKDYHLEIFANFVFIMDGFKYGDVCAEETMRRACNIFREHTEYIQGFNMFLPPEYKIVIQSNDQGISEPVVSLPSPRGPPIYCKWRTKSDILQKQEIELYKQWKQSRTANKTSSLANGANCSGSRSTGDRTRGGGAAHTAGDGGVSGLPIYMIDFHLDEAMSHRHKTPATNQQFMAQESEKYIKEVEYWYRDESKTVNSFLDVMRRFRSRRIDLPSTVQRLCYLFRDNFVLISNFNIFLEPGCGIEIFSNQDVSVALLWMTPHSEGSALRVKTYTIPITSEAIPPNPSSSEANPIMLQLQNFPRNRSTSISESDSIARPSTLNPINDLSNQDQNLHQINQSETVELQNQPVEFNNEISDDNNVKKN